MNGRTVQILQLTEVPQIQVDLTKILPVNYKDIQKKFYMNS